MLDNPLGAELVDVFLVNVQHLSAEALRVDVLGRVGGVVQLMNSFRQAILREHLHRDPARFPVLPSTRHNLVDLPAAVEDYNLHAALWLHKYAGIAVIAVCNFHYHFNFSLLARHCPARLLLLCLRLCLDLLQTFLLDALLVLLDSQANF
ncbi:hypothetical protein D3C84_893350 [compost metagenome]